MRDTAISFELEPPTIEEMQRLCAALYGAANGIMTIVRGTAVADLIGHAHYGALTMSTMVAKSLAPVATAAIWTATGDPSVMLWTLLASALVGAVGFLLAIMGVSAKPGDGLVQT